MELRKFLQNDIIIFSLILLIFISGCISAPQNQQQNYTVGDLAVIGYRVEPVEIETATNMLVVNAEIADTLEKQRKGLMFRTSLAEEEGMLFIFSNEQQRIFWMKDVKISLDIIFISANGEIVEIKKNFLPCNADPCPTYTSQKHAKYVLEVNAGFVDKNGLELGNKVNLP